MITQRRRSKHIPRIWRMPNLVLAQGLRVMVWERDSGAP